MAILSNYAVFAGFGVDRKLVLVTDGKKEIKEVPGEQCKERFRTAPRGRRTPSPRKRSSPAGGNGDDEWSGR